MDSPELPRSGERVGITQALTPHGLEMRRTPWYLGLKVTGEGYVHRQDEGQALALLQENHIVLIQGGFRTGKSSLANAVSREFSLQTGVPEIEDWEISSDQISASDEFVISPDEVDWNSGRFTKFVDGVKDLQQTGRAYIVLECNGNVTDDVPLPDTSVEESRKMKQTIRQLVGDTSIVNIEPATPDQIRQVMRDKGQPIFSAPMENWLVKQAGGNLLWAQHLASAAYHELQNKFGLNSLDVPSRPAKKNLLNIFQREKEKTFTWTEIWQAIEKHLGQTDNKGHMFVFSQISTAIDYVSACGFNPETWEYSSSGHPDVRFYQNVLPSGSDVFNRLMHKYLSHQSSNPPHPT